MRRTKENLVLFCLFCLCFGILTTPATAQTNVPILSVPKLDSIWYDHLIERGEDFADNALLKEAFYREALRLEPQRLEAVDHLTTLYEAGGESVLEMAGLLYAQLLDHQPSRMQRITVLKPSFQRPSGDDLLETTARQALDKTQQALHEENYLNAELQLRQALASHPLEPSILKYLAFTEQEAGDTPMLAWVYGFYFAFYPEDSDMANNYSRTLENIGLHEAAYGILRQALRVQPHNQLLLSRTAEAGTQLGKIKEVEDMFRQRTAAQPENFTALVMYAEWLRRQDRIREARFYLTRAWTVIPNRREPPYLLASILLKEGYTEDALFWLDELHSIVPAKTFWNLIEETPFSDTPELKALIETRIATK